MYRRRAETMEGETELNQKREKEITKEERESEREQNMRDRFGCEREQDPCTGRMRERGR